MFVCLGPRATLGLFDLCKAWRWSNQGQPSDPARQAECLDAAAPGAPLVEQSVPVVICPLWSTQLCPQPPRESPRSGPELGPLLLSLGSSSQVPFAAITTTESFAEFYGYFQQITGPACGFGRLNIDEVFFPHRCLQCSTTLTTQLLGHNHSLFRHLIATEPLNSS